MKAMKARLPDFLIAGAPRCGTTWLCHLLDRHPDIYLAKPFQPEPKFFLIDELYKQGIQHYAGNWFQNVGLQQICGEKSTNYMESSIAAARIYKHLPKVKLIFILREPASRAFSNYLWSSMNGLETEDFRSALDLEDKRESQVHKHLKYARPHALFSRGLYAKHLQVYFDLFDRKQILCLRYEDIHKSPESLAERLHLFLGLTPRPKDASRLGVINASRESSIEIPRKIFNILRDRYAEPNKQLAKLLGSEFDIWEV